MITKRGAVLALTLSGMALQGASAQKSFPTISAQATGGILPWRDDSLEEQYAAAGFVDLDSGAAIKADCFQLFLRLMDEPKYRGMLFGEISAMVQFNRMQRSTWT